MSTATLTKPVAKAKPRVIIGEQDRKVIQWAIRVKYFTGPMAHDHLYRGNSAIQGTYRQLKRLVVDGWFEPLDGEGNWGRPNDVRALYVPTKKAYKVFGEGLTYPKDGVSHNTLRHNLAIGEVALDYAAAINPETGENMGMQVITDCEIQSEIHTWKASGEAYPPEDAEWIVTGYDEPKPARGRFGAETSNRGYRTHAPDLVVIDPWGQRHAIEMELSIKSTDRLMEVLAAFGRNEDKYTSVVYYTPDQRTEDRVRKVAGMVTTRHPQLIFRRYTPEHSRKV